jgi:hypothetical protein
VRDDEAVAVRDESDAKKPVAATTSRLVAPAFSFSSSDDAWSSEEEDAVFASVPPMLQKRVISSVYLTV